MILNFFLYGLILTILPIIYLSEKSEIKFKKNIVIGITLPKEAQNDQEVLDILKTFLKNQKIVLNASVLLTIILAYLTRLELNMTVYLTFMFLTIIAPFVVHILSYRKLRDLKDKKYPNKEIELNHTISVDTSLIDNDKSLNPIYFIITILLALLPAIFDRTRLFLYLTFSLTSVLYYLIYRYTYRKKSERINDDLALTEVLTRVRRYNWNKIWLILCLSNILFSISVFIFRYSSLFSALVMTVSIILILYFSIRIELKTREIQEKLTKDVDYVFDEDRHWLYGLFYYNPDDSNLMINNRVGIGSTFNLAKPTGKIISGLSIILLLLTPLFGVYIDSFIRGEINLSANESQVIVVLGERKLYNVNISDIESAELIDELPKKMTRTNGTAVENLLTGHFATNTDKYKVCLDPKVKPYILIRTKDTNYIFGSRDPEHTSEIYNKIQALIGR